eukprot:255538-Amphidinium_carterae.1
MGTHNPATTRLEHLIQNFYVHTTSKHPNVTNRRPSHCDGIGAPFIYAGIAVMVEIQVSLSLRASTSSSVCSRAATRSSKGAASWSSEASPLAVAPRISAQNLRAGMRCSLTKVRNSWESSAIGRSRKAMPSSLRVKRNRRV